MIDIVIPTINRADLLEESVKDLKDTGVLKQARLLIIDNANQDLSFLQNYKNTMTYRPGTNLGVAGSWNYGMRRAFEWNDTTQAVFVLNDDIVMGKTPEELKLIAKKAVDTQTLITSTQHWCAFIIPRAVYNQVGMFDENFFPAYFEDNDYSYRLKLAGLRHLRDNDFDPKIFRNSQTIAKDPSISTNFDENKAYFKEKWGGPPAEETYKAPYGYEPLGGWSISEELFSAMKDLIPVGEPFLEFGSGQSTPILNHYWKTTSVEHDPLWQAKLKGKYDYIPASIKFNGLGKTYDLSKENQKRVSEFEYILIDGPVSDRRGLAEYYGMFKNAKIIIVDDTNRANERELVKLLEERYDIIDKKEIPTSNKSATILWQSI